MIRNAPIQRLGHSQFDSSPIARVTHAKCLARFSDRLFGSGCRWRASAAVCLPMMAALHCNAQTRIQAWANGNLLGQGPYLVVDGATAIAESSFAYGDRAEARGYSSASGVMSAFGKSDNGGLSNGIGGLGDVRHTARLRGPTGATIPATIGYNVAFSMDLFTEFVASHIPQSIAIGSVDYTVRIGVTTQRGHVLEAWQNGLLVSREATGVGTATRTYSLVPSVSLDQRVHELTPSDLHFLQIDLNLAQLSPEEFALINLSDLAGSITQGIFNLGLPAWELGPGFTVGVGYGVQCVSTSTISSVLQLGAGSQLIDGFIQNQSKSGPSAKAKTSIDLFLSGIAVSESDLPGLLADPRFSVLSDGRLAYFDQTGHLLPVAVVVDSGALGQREFSVFAGSFTACEGPTVALPNTSVSTCRDGTAQISVVASGTTPITYQWRRNHTPIDGGPGGNPTSLTDTLSLSHVTPADEASYDCVVSNLCGSVTSPPATLSICGADLTCDGFLDFFDYDAFVLAFESGSGEADFNGDGFLDFFDYDDFVAAFEAGC